MSSAAAIADRPANDLVTRCGSPGRGAILTALVTAALIDGNFRAILVLARTGRPRSLLQCGLRPRWLALAALERLYPDANHEALCAALGCQPSTSTDNPGRTDRRRGEWTPAVIDSVAHQVATEEDGVLTARWIWPSACAVTAAHTGADAEAVATVTGAMARPPRALGQARKLAVYLTMIEGDVPAKSMASATGLDRKTVRQHAQAVEEQRDADGELDEALDAMAVQLRARLDKELSQW